MININNKLDLIKNEIKELDEKIIKEKDLNKLHKQLYQVKKSLLKIKIEYDEYKLNNFKDNEIERQIDNYSDNVEVLFDYYNHLLLKKNHKNINNISIINTIFLPLALITGYFGMNFSHMGNPTLSKGILAIKNSHYFIIFLFIVCIIITLLLFHFNIFNN